MVTIATRNPHSHFSPEQNERFIGPDCFSGSAARAERFPQCKVIYTPPAVLQHGNTDVDKTVFSFFLSVCFTVNIYHSCMWISVWSNTTGQLTPVCLCICARVTVCVYVCDREKKKLHAHTLLERDTTTG